MIADSLEDSEFRDMTFNQVTAKMISAAALRGDKLALEAFEVTGRYLGEALANSVNHTSPKAIFLFGGIALSADMEKAAEATDEAADQMKADTEEAADDMEADAEKKMEMDEEAEDEEAEEEDEGKEG